MLQNALGAVIASLLGLHPLFGVLNGSVTLTGGPATGLAFAPLFEAAGVAGAATAPWRAAMAGIISGGLIGGPIGTILVKRPPPGACTGGAGGRSNRIAAQIVEDQSA